MIRVLIATVVGGFLCGCEDKEIHSYRAPKEPVKSAAPAAAAPQDGQVVWTAPDGWEKVASEQSVRIATYRPGPGLPEVVLTAFPGDVGGLLANVNRWRGQVGLEALTEAQLGQAVERGVVEGVRYATVDFPAINKQELLGAVIEPGDGKTWFLKALGDAEAIAKIKPGFAAFVKSFRMQGGAPKAPQAEVAPKPTPPAVAPTKDVQSRLAAWPLPQNWKVDPEASSMVAAGFLASSAEGAVKVTATVLVNDGGGALANINRWREQLGLPELQKLEQQQVTDLGGGNLVVDLASADSKRRMMAAIISAPGGTWFFKMTGSPKGVEAEKEQFEKLVRGVGLGEQGK